MKKIKEAIRTQLQPQEEILSVQRQHWLSLVFPLFLQFIIILLLIGGLMFLIHLEYPIIFFKSAILLSLLLLSLLALLGTFLVMDWYFHFYIITNKRMISDHFFKLSGPYYEEVFLKETIESVDRIEKNIVYDAFGIEDVSVRFPSFARAEPFVFISPSNPEEIERIIEKFSTERKSA